MNSNDQEAQEEIPEKIQEEIICFSCKKITGLHFDSKISRSEECPFCYASLHSCLMCNFYDKTAYNECHESEARRILEKDKSNFCDFFILKSSSAENLMQKKDKLFDAAAALFKK